MVLEDNEDDDDYPRHATKKAKLDNFVTKTHPDLKEKLDLQVARFFFSCNLAFKNVENKECLKLMELLRPGYKPPHRRHLAGDLLEKVSDEVDEKVKFTIRFHSF